MYVTWFLTLIFQNMQLHTETTLQNQFLRTLGDKVAPENAALVVVDVQNEFCADDGVFGKAGNDLSMVQEMLPNLQRLIEGARAAGVPVIFVQAIYDPQYLPPAWHERNARIGFETPRCLSGTWGADFYKVAPMPGEAVVRKHRYSAFVDTELDLILRSQQIRTVIVAGVATNICVESTARDAFMKDYYVVFMDDASATYKKEAHEAAVANVALAFGTAATVGEVLDAWSLHSKK
ncbi:MAG: Isochorismatase hydrolase [Herminiimonas sp.]|nr:Isochorismatase hydrolase [Herminiimonas sp.]